MTLVGIVPVTTWCMLTFCLAEQLIGFIHDNCARRICIKIFQWTNTHTTPVNQLRQSCMCVPVTGTSL